MKRINAIKAPALPAAGHLLIALLLATIPLGAQTTASIHGTVTDESGALIAGASMRAVNTLTNEVRNARTNERGYYRFAELAVGAYSVEAGMEGFKTVVRTGVELSLNRNAQVDIQLAVGTITEKVSVVADAPQVETTTNEMGTLVNQQRVVELPINGRNTLSLVALIPGAQNLQTGNAQGFSENKASINGAREEDSSWLLDGGDNTSPLRNYGNDVPNPDAIQEFRVITSNYSAEYGRTAGAVVNVITRSGTNEFHGSLFEFLRNRSLNARNFFQADTTALVQNQFGGSAGGRIIRDRTFFFGSYQGFLRRTADFRNRALVPTSTERSGDFSNTVIGGQPLVVRDPVTSQPFPGSRIPTSRLSQVGLNYLKAAVPLPNDPGRGPNNLTQIASVPRDENQFLGKIDHSLSGRHKLSGGYFLSDQVDTTRLLSDIDFAWREIQIRQQNLNVHEYWTIGPTMLNHLRATYTRSAGNRKILPDDLTLADLGSNFTPLPDGPKMPPAFSVTGWFSNGSANGGPKFANAYTVANTFDWVKGRHELKFGVEGWLHKMNDVSTAPRMGGSGTFDGSFTGNGMPDLLLGQVRTLEVAAQTYKSQNSWVLNWFVQDKMRLTRRLVLNLGVRYELSTWPVHPLDALIAFVPGRQSACVPQAPVGVVFPCDDGIPRSGVLGDYNNYAPRVGVAYDLTGDGKTAIRAGYGISYGFSFLNALQEQQVSVPFQFRATIRDTTLEDPYSRLPGGKSPFPLRFDPDNLQFASGGSYGFQDFNMRTAYVQQYNFTIQRQVARDWSAEVGYVGNVGRKLMGQLDYNTPLRTPDATRTNIDQRRPLFPAMRDTRMSGSFVNSSYNALQARVEKRFSSGFTLMGSYTYSKALDESSWYSSRNEWADAFNRKLNWGRGESDRRNMLALSWVWETPLYAGSHRAVKLLANGWSINGIATFYSGPPIEVTSGRDNDWDGNSSGDRPDVVGNWQLDPNRARQEVIAAWFNPKAFVENQPGRLGNVGRNVLTGPGMKNLDLGIARSFSITERHKLQFRAEGFNVMNWVNLQNPEGRASNPLFGVITSAGDPRILQFGLKYQF